MTKTALVHLAGLTLLVAIAAFAIARIAPPPSLPKTAAQQNFSAERAAAHLDVIARAPHPSGSREHANVRDYLVRTLGGLGLSPRVHEGSAAIRSAGKVFSMRAKNVIARLPGTRGSGPAVALVAHYDSVPESRGASDDGAGVVTLLETARALTARPPLENDVVFIFTDGEEMAFLGAQALLDDPAALGEIGVVFNFEARGTHGAVAMYDASPNAGLLVAELASAVPRPITSSFICALAMALPNDSDVAAFKRAGYPALGFAYADGLEHYHRNTDDPAHIDHASLQHAGMYALSLATRFGARPLDRLEAPDVVFFDVFGAVIVRYGVTTARVFAALTIAGLVLLTIVGLRKGALTGRGVAKGAGIFVLGIVISALVVTLSQWILGHFVDFFMQVARAKLFFWHAVLVASATLVFGYGRVLKKTDAKDLAFGAALVWAVVLAVCAVLVPAVTAPFEWPLFFWLGGAFVWIRRGDGAIALASSYVAAAPAVAMFAGIVYTVSVATGATMAFAPILFFALLAGLLVPIIAAHSAESRGAFALVALVASVGAAGAALITARYGATEPRTDSLLYAFDTDSGAARWLSHDAHLDDFTQQRLQGATVQRQPSFVRGGGSFWVADAPTLAIEPIGVDVLGDTTTSDARTLTLRIHASAAARCVRVWDERGSIARAVSIDAAPVHDVFRFSPETDESLMRMMTGDDSPRVWRMEHCALGPGGMLDVTLAAKPGDAIQLRIVEEREGFPELEGPRIAPRGEGLVPAYDSDVTLISRPFTL